MQNCSNLSCASRHPNDCKFSEKCKFWKTNNCYYAHVTLAKKKSKVEEPQVEIDENTEQNEVVKTVIQEKNNIIDELKNKLEEQKELFEKELENIRREF